MSLCLVVTGDAQCDCLGDLATTARPLHCEGPSLTELLSHLRGDTYECCLTFQGMVLISTDDPPTILAHITSYTGGGKVEVFEFCYVSLPSLCAIIMYVFFFVELFQWLPLCFRKSIKCSELILYFPTQI